MSDPVIDEPVTIVPDVPTTSGCVKDYFPTHELIPCDQWTACPNVVSAGGVPTKYFPQACSSLPTYPTATTVPVTTTSAICPPGSHWNTPVGGAGWCSTDDAVTVPTITSTIADLATTPTTIDPCGDFSTPEVCAQFQGRTPVGKSHVAVAQKPTASTLPMTGSNDATPIVSGGLLAVVVGAALVAITRRRNRVLPNH